MGIFKRCTFAAALLVAATCLSAQVKVWQGTFELPTYEEGVPDPNPPFDQLTSNRFNYPYTLRTNLTDRRADHKWRAIVLENEYLKCTVLPDLGGHLYTCIDKINGKPMFYANSSIKKANIGYRGAWAAFGVEYNFPVSHNWMSLSPIDFTFSQNPDGSASVTVGNVDRVYGMQWTVEMLLRPKSTVLEQRVTLSNRSDVRHRFYWWNNAGVEVWDDSRVQYPMRFAASHGFAEVQPWPVDSTGRDLSIIRNQTDGPVSLFVHGSREPFMGIWNPETNSGTVHFANYDELPGKKIWSWGVDADGLDWRKALSDNNSAYVEVQGGLFRNQETYAFLEPRRTIRFSEYWMPAREIGGITRASLAGVLSLKREAGNLVIAFNSNQPNRAASVHLLGDRKQVWSTVTDLLPERTFSKTIPLSDAQRKYTVEIRDANGNLFMRHTEDQYDWTPSEAVKVGPQKKQEIPPAERRSEDDWLQLGENQELNGKLLAALDTYQKLLQKYPDSYPGMKAAGRLAATLLHYEEAVRYLEPARAANTTDAELAYYLGMAYDGFGDEQEARDAFESSYRLPQWRAAAALRLGELSARQGDVEKAEQYLIEATNREPEDARAAEELVAVKGARGNRAQALAQQTLRHFPLSYVLREMTGTADLQQFANDDSRILNLATEYMRLGFYQKALEVLSRIYPVPIADESEPGSVPASRNPMIAYYRAYCREQLRESAAADYALASHLPTDYVFPNSAEDLIVLRAAAKANPADANAHYLLGTLYFSKALTDQALAEWERARELNWKIPVIDADIGIALLHVKNDAAAAASAFENGIRTDPHNEAVYVGADETLSILGKLSGERVQALDRYPDKTGMPSDLVFELALNLAEEQKFDDAEALFRDRFFPRQEGGTNVRQVWIELRLERALTLANQKQCDEAISVIKGLAVPVPGVSFTSDGMQPFLDSARVQYLIGEMNARCNRANEASSNFRNAYAKTGAGEIAWAWMAAKHVPEFHQEQWRPRLKSALEQAAAMSETSSFAGWWVYNRAMIQRALGNESEATRDLREVFLLPDRLLSYHLAREATATQ